MAQLQGGNNMQSKILRAAESARSESLLQFFLRRISIASAVVLLSAVSLTAYSSSSASGAATGVAHSLNAASRTGGACKLLAASAALADPQLPSGLPCPVAGKPWTIGVLAVGDCPYCSGLVSAYKAEATLLGVKLTILDGQLNPALQAQQMNQLIAQKPNIIVAVPIDIQALIPGMARAKQAGIPVVDATIKVAASGTKYVVGYVGINDTLAGKLSADVLIQGLKSRKLKSGTIAIVAGGAGGSEVLRTAGFEAEMHKLAPAFKLVGPQFTDFTKQDALSKTQDMITRIGSKLVAIWGEDDTVASGVVQAAAQSGRSNLVIVGMNGNKAGIANIKKGSMYGTVLQDPYVDGAWSIIYAVDYLDGKIPAKYVALSQPIITKANVAKFSPGW